MTKVVFLILTFNRLQYTKETLESLFKNKYSFHLCIYDNGSSEPGLIEYLKNIKNKESRIIDLQFSKINSGLSIPTNSFWKAHKDIYPYLGKIDNDTIIPEDAVARLVDIMDNCPNVAICHGHHWFDVNFSQKRLKNINGRLLLKIRWGGGCFYLIRSSIVHKFGYIPEKHGKMGGWTEYQNKVRRRGNNIVYAYPLIKVRHLGDKLSGRVEEEKNYTEYNNLIKEIRRRKN
jgi:GT2 family glycosyltransferase